MDDANTYVSSVVIKSVMVVRIFFLSQDDDDYRFTFVEWDDEPNWDDRPLTYVRIVRDTDREISRQVVHVLTGELGRVVDFGICQMDWDTSLRDDTTVFHAIDHEDDDDEDSMNTEDEVRDDDDEIFIVDINSI